MLRRGSPVGNAVRFNLFGGSSNDALVDDAGEFVLQFGLRIIGSAPDILVAAFAPVIRRFLRRIPELRVEPHGEVLLLLFGREGSQLLFSQFNCLLGTGSVIPVIVPAEIAIEAEIADQRMAVHCAVGIVEHTNRIFRGRP